MQRTYYPSSNDDAHDIPDPRWLPPDLTSWNTSRVSLSPHHILTNAALIPPFMEARSATPLQVVPHDRCHSISPFSGIYTLKNVLYCTNYGLGMVYDGMKLTTLRLQKKGIYLVSPRWSRIDRVVRCDDNPCPLGHISQDANYYITGLTCDTGL